MLVEMDPARPRPRAIRLVAEALLEGECVVYPTDTCYGLGADIFNKKAIEKAYRIKGVPRTTPFSFVCPDLRDISRYARVSDYAYRVMKRLLPGPYTFVLEGSRQVPKMMLTRRKTVGIRVPDHPIAIALARELGRPILSTSVSLQGGAVFADPREAAEALDGLVAYVIDSGIIPPEPSSVVSLIGDEPEVLREGKGPVDLFL